MSERPIVAVSEEREWLTVLMVDHWVLYRGDVHEDGWADWGYAVEDKGQTAEDALATLIAKHEEGLEKTRLQERVLPDSFKATRLYVSGPRRD